MKFSNHILTSFLFTGAAATSAAPTTTKTASSSSNQMMKKGLVTAFTTSSSSSSSLSRSSFVSSSTKRALSSSSLISDPTPSHRRNINNHYIQATTAFVNRHNNNIINNNRRTMTTSTRLNANVLKLNDPQKQLLDHVDIFIFDCDGVIWKGDTLINGVAVTLEKLRAAGKRMFFVTNNSTKSRAGYKKKFDSLGLNIPAEEIFSSSFAAAAYFEQINFKASGKKVYVIGEIGICEELDLINVPYIGGPNDVGKQPNMGPNDSLIIDDNVGAVVVGFDRHINYYKIQYAQLCINKLKALFIATNLDAVTHLTDAQKWAGNGSMVGAIKGCCPNTPPIVVGKPSSLMIEYLEKKYNIIDRKRICMVGDRLDTDILFGTDNGLQSILVLSGVTNIDTMISSHITPDYYANTINDFFITDTSTTTTTTIEQEAIMVQQNQK